MIYYNYITTNIFNGKQYVGMHKTEDLNDGYLGSGKLLNYAIKKYGKERFTREILCFCEDANIAHFNEGKFIIKYNTIAPSGYNLSQSGGPSHLGKKHSEETKRKIRESFTEDKKEKMRFFGEKNGFFCKKHSEETKEKLRLFGEKNPMFGKNHSEKSKKKMSESRLLYLQKKEATFLRQPPIPV